MKRIYNLLALLVLFSMAEITGLQDAYAAIPSTQARSITVSNVEKTTATITWLNGNGTGRLVVVFPSTVDTATVNNAVTTGTEYTGNAAFGSSGSQIGSTGAYAVYRATGSTRTVNVTGLTAGTTYNVRVYEYRNDGTPDPEYNRAQVSNNPRSFTTDEDIPDAPTALATKSGSKTTSGFILTYNNSSSADYYELQVDNNSDFSSPLSDYDAVDIGKPNPAEFEIGGLTHNTQYFYRLRTVFDGQTSLWSTTANETTLEDVTPPTVSKIERFSPLSDVATNADQVTYRVTFSEDVTGVATGDFETSSDDDAIGTPSDISEISSSEYDITVNTITGDGTLRLDFTGSVTDLNGNACAALYEFINGEVYNIDNTAPAQVLAPVLATTGDGQITGYYNIASTGVTVGFTVPSEVGGNYTLQAWDADANSGAGSWINVTGHVAIPIITGTEATANNEAGDVASISISEAALVTLGLVKGAGSEDNDGQTLEFRVNSTDLAGNASLDGVESNAVTIDETAPATDLVTFDRVAVRANNNDYVNDLDNDDVFTEYYNLNARNNSHYVLFRRYNDPTPEDATLFGGAGYIQYKVGAEDWKYLTYLGNNWNAWSIDAGDDNLGTRHFTLIDDATFNLFNDLQAADNANGVVYSFRVVYTDIAGNIQTENTPSTHNVIKDIVAPEAIAYLDKTISTTPGTAGVFFDNNGTNYYNSTTNGITIQAKIAGADATMDATEGATVFVVPYYNQSTPTPLNVSYSNHGSLGAYLVNADLETGFNEFQTKTVEVPFEEDANAANLTANDVLFFYVGAVDEAGNLASPNIVGTGVESLSTPFTFKYDITPLDGTVYFYSADGNDYVGLYDDPETEYLEGDFNFDVENRLRIEYSTYGYTSESGAAILEASYNTTSLSLDSEGDVRYTESSYPETVYDEQLGFSVPTGNTEYYNNFESYYFPTSNDPYVADNVEAAFSITVRDRAGNVTTVDDESDLNDSGDPGDWSIDQPGIDTKVPTAANQSATPVWEVYVGYNEDLQESIYEIQPTKYMFGVNVGDPVFTTNTEKLQVKITLPEGWIDNLTEGGMLKVYPSYDGTTFNSYEYVYIDLEDSDLNLDGNVLTFNIYESNFTNMNGSFTDRDNDLVAQFAWDPAETTIYFKFELVSNGGNGSGVKFPETAIAMDVDYKRPVPTLLSSMTSSTGANFAAFSVLKSGEDHSVAYTNADYIGYNITFDEEVKFSNNKFMRYNLAGPYTNETYGTPGDIRHSQSNAAFLYDQNYYDIDIDQTPSQFTGADAQSNLISLNAYGAFTDPSTGNNTDRIGTDWIVWGRFNGNGKLYFRLLAYNNSGAENLNTYQGRRIFDAAGNEASKFDLNGDSEFNYEEDVLTDDGNGTGYGYPVTLDNIVPTATVELTPSTNENDAYVWGYSANGAIGNGNNTANVTTTTILAGGDKWNAIEAGYDHTLAIKSDGTLWAWGINDYGQLGDGTTTLKNVPTQIGSDTWIDIAVSFKISYGIKSDGTLWAWGFNENGILGDGTLISKSAPVQIGSATNWTKVDASTTSVLAINESHELWGVTPNDQLYIGTNTGNSLTLKQVGNGTTDWADIQMYTYHALLLKTNGTLWSFGFNGDGRTGLNTGANNTFLPTQIGTDTWISIAAGNRHSLAVKSDGTLWGWGNTDAGAVGDGQTAEDRLIPVQIGSATNWTTVGTGPEFSFAINASGHLYGWGRNYHNNLGFAYNGNIFYTSPQLVDNTRNWTSVSGGENFSAGIVGGPISIVKEATVGTGTFVVEATFTEGMDEIEPTVEFSSNVANTLTNGSGAWSIDNTVFTMTYDVADNNEEINNITVTVSGAKDLSGSTIAPKVLTNRVKIDTKAPEVLSINRKTPANAETNATSVVYTVTFSESVTGIAAGDFTPFDVNDTFTEGTVSAVSATSGTAVDVTVSGISGIGELRLDFTGSVNDLVGNLGDVNFEGQTYTIDNAPLEVVINRNAITYGATGGFTTKDDIVSFDINFNKEVKDFTIVDISINVTGTVTPLNLTGATLTTDEASLGEYTLTIPSVAGNGTLGITIDNAAFTDLANNSMAADAVSGLFTIDNENPIAANIASLVSTGNTIVSAYFNSTNDGVTATFTIPTGDASLVGGTYSVDYRLTDEANWAPLSTPDYVDVEILADNLADGDGNVGEIGKVQTITLTEAQINALFHETNPIADGSKLNFKVRLYDVAGNSSNGNAFPNPITFDQTAPSVLSIKNVANTETQLTNGNQLTYFVTFSEPVNYVGLADFAVAPIDDNVDITEVVVTPESSPVNSKYTISVWTTVEDEHILTVVDDATEESIIRDEAGNYLSSLVAETNQTYTVDQTAPEAPLITSVGPDNGTSGSDKITNTGALTISGTAEAFSTVEIYNDESLLSTTTADEEGDWSVTFDGEEGNPSPLTEGEYSFTASATDAATNVSDESAANGTWVIDLTAPGIKNNWYTPAAVSEVTGYLYNNPSQYNTRVPAIGTDGWDASERKKLYGSVDAGTNDNVYFRVSIADDDVTMLGTTVSLLAKNQEDINAQFELIGSPSTAITEVEMYSTGYKLVTITEADLDELGYSKIEFKALYIDVAGNEYTSVDKAYFGLYNDLPHVDYLTYSPIPVELTINSVEDDALTGECKQPGDEILINITTVDALYTEDVDQYLVTLDNGGELYTLEVSGVDVDINNTEVKTLIVVIPQDTEFSEGGLYDLNIKLTDYDGNEGTDSETESLTINTQTLSVDLSSTDAEICASESGITFSYSTNIEIGDAETIAVYRKRGLLTAQISEGVTTDSEQDGIFVPVAQLETGDEIYVVLTGTGVCNSTESDKVAVIVNQLPTAATITRTGTANPVCYNDNSGVVLTIDQAVTNKDAFSDYTYEINVNNTGYVALPSSVRFALSGDKNSVLTITNITAEGGAFASCSTYTVRVTKTVEASGCLRVTESDAITVNRQLNDITGYTTGSAQRNQTISYTFTAPTVGTATSYRWRVISSDGDSLTSANVSFTATTTTPTNNIYFSTSIPFGVYRIQVQPIGACDVYDVNRWPGNGVGHAVTISPTPSSAITFSSVGQNQMTVGWTNGSYDGKYIISTQCSTTTNYMANAITVTSGTVADVLAGMTANLNWTSAVGSGLFRYGGTANTFSNLSPVDNTAKLLARINNNTDRNITVTGLVKSKRYHFRIIDFNNTTTPTDLFLDASGPANSRGTSAKEGDEFSVIGSMHSVSAISPNPAKDFINFDLTLVEDANVTITIHSLEGSVVMNIKANELMSAGTHNFNIPLKDLAAGAYAISFSFGQDAILETFMVMP